MNEYFLAVISIIQVLNIISIYILYKRKIVYEAALMKIETQTSLKDLIIIILLMVLIFGVHFYVFSPDTRPFFGRYVSIIILSMIIQFMITKDKVVPSLYIEKNVVTVNTLFIKSYDLAALHKIYYDGFSEQYIL
ncbi:MAG: hypothetical protein JST86_09935 [Bacteroidetes bacterium]|nr:hypothetical protein [Bacteroidota bacterium]